MRICAMCIRAWRGDVRSVQEKNPITPALPAGKSGACHTHTLPCTITRCEGCPGLFGTGLLCPKCCARQLPASLAGCSLAYQARLPYVEPATYFLRTVLREPLSTARMVCNDSRLRLVVNRQLVRCLSRDPVCSRTSGCYGQDHPARSWRGAGRSGLWSVRPSAVSDTCTGGRCCRLEWPS